jgi:hypothetical protein
MWTQETTSTGHVASFQSDCGLSYVWATQFDFDAGIDAVQFIISDHDFFHSRIDVFFKDENDTYGCARQQAERLANPEKSLQDWPDFAFHF